jgi:L-threonylcarbamoyladenylate synthase
VARIYPASDETISFLSEKLLGGEIVAVPTETVYGLAGNAFNESACAEIFRAKARPSFDPLIVHLPIGYDLDRVAETNPIAELLSKTYWPGPLTLVLPKKPAIPDLVTSGFASVAVRIPRHPVFQQLLRRCQLPLAAPSANPFGYVSPTTAQHVADSLGDRIASILDGGPCEIGLESTIVDIRDPERPVLLRPGAISREDLANAIGRPLSDPAPNSREIVPGQLEKHYSPRSECRLFDRLDPADAPRHPDRAYLFFTRPVGAPDNGPDNIFSLTENGDDREAARNLFKTLREIDARGFASIHAERAPDTGLGHAINNRLHRAAASG